jgi:acyl carrier protein
MNHRSEQVRALILRHLAEPLSAAGVEQQKITEDFDLRLHGVLDSFGFVTLLTYLEQQLGAALTVVDLEPADLTRVGPLSRHIASQWRT